VFNKASRSICSSLASSESSPEDRYLSPFNFKLATSPLQLGINRS
jgi:hypothetical protein